MVNCTFSINKGQLFLIWPILKSEAKLWKPLAFELLSYIKFIYVTFHRKQKIHTQNISKLKPFSQIFLFCVYVNSVS